MVQLIKSFLLTFLSGYLVHIFHFKNEGKISAQESEFI
ncbi:MAG: hypothetical protein ACI9XO_003009 [Paraglaciecola sp.]|jgi:hypothetical protein